MASENRSGVVIRRYLEFVKEHGYVTEIFNPNYKSDSLAMRVRIRKLTPRECWRLMGFSDAEFDKAASVCGDTQLYRQAGNSIVTNILYCILLNLSDIIGD